MDPNNDLPQLSTCTTCRFVEDKSNYWTAVLYFKHPNGSFIRVSLRRLWTSSIDSKWLHDPGPPNGQPQHGPWITGRRYDCLLLPTFWKCSNHGLQEGRRATTVLPPRYDNIYQGFRMIVGNPFRRSNDLSPNSLASKTTSFRCFQGDYLGDGVPGYGPADSFDLPKGPCTGGIRSNIYFPR